MGREERLIFPPLAPPIPAPAQLERLCSNPAYITGRPVKSSLQVPIDKNNISKPLTTCNLLVFRGGNGSHSFHLEHGCPETLSGEPGLPAEQKGPSGNLGRGGDSSSAARPGSDPGEPKAGGLSGSGHLTRCSNFGEQWPNTSENRGVETWSPFQRPDQGRVPLGFLPSQQQRPVV